MVHLKVKKGYDVQIEGKPSGNIEILPEPERIGVTPSIIPFIKPRLKVDVGDKVKIGSLLFEDKKRPDTRFLSPASGIIEDIRFGRRRVILEIVIRRDDAEEQEPFEMISEKALQDMDRDTLIGHIQKGGLWPLFRQLPYRKIAEPDSVPEVVFVSFDNKEPFLPDPEAYLRGNINFLEFGIRILWKLAKKVNFSTSIDNSFVLKEMTLKNFARIVTHTVDGAYPADDPGVVAYCARKGTELNRAWYLDGQDLLLIARLLKRGRYPVERIISLGGGSASQKLHLKTRQGVPLSHITNLYPVRNGGGKTRYIVGGVFRGFSSSRDSYMGFYENALTLLPEGDEKELFGFARPGYDKPSYSRAFMSHLHDKTLPADCNIHGDPRGCINCGTCAKVCPVDMLPQYTFKAVLAEEVEESLQHGLLDCVECGLCSYVCPSKIEIRDILKNAKSDYYQEQA